MVFRSRWCDDARRMPLVFTYGPDTYQGRVYDRAGPAELLSTAVLEGWQLVFDKPNPKQKGEGLANLAETPGTSTFGLLYDLSVEQLENLDGYYGGYEQRAVPVKVRDAEDPERWHTKSAKTWIARRTSKGLRPSAAALELVKKGFTENGAPAEFLEALSGIEVLP